MSENDVIELLINWESQDGKTDLRHLFNVVSGPLDFHDFLEYKGVYITKNVLREEMGFDKGSKPGDFDILLIPFSEHKIYFDRTAAFEVKIVRPTRVKIDKSPNSIGLTQIEGLINDGFPLISLIHVCMPEPLFRSEMMSVKFSTTPVNNGQKFNFDEYENSFIDVKYDQFPRFAADKQMTRLLSLEIPKYVGINTLGLSLDEDSRFVISDCSEKFKYYKEGYFNPHKRSETINRIANHFESHKNKYIKRAIR